MWRQSSPKSGPVYTAQESTDATGDHVHTVAVVSHCSLRCRGRRPRRAIDVGERIDKEMAEDAAETCGGTRCERYPRTQGLREVVWNPGLCVSAYTAIIAFIISASSSSAFFAAAWASAVAMISWAVFSIASRSRGIRARTAAAASAVGKTM